MRVEIGDLVFCHTIGNKMGWRLNQVGIVVAGSKKNTRFRAFLSSGSFDEFTTADVEKGNVEIIAKANGERVVYSDDLEIIPNYTKRLQEAATNIDDKALERTLSQRLIKSKRRKVKIKI
jgi:hypothetical protein